MERHGIPGRAIALRFEVMTRRSSLGNPPVSGRAVARRPARLPARQREVAGLIAHGLLNREINDKISVVDAVWSGLLFTRRKS